MYVLSDSHNNITLDVATFIECLAKFVNTM